MSNVIDPLFNPLSPEFIKSPYQCYQVLREQHPVYLTSYGFWVIAGYNDVRLSLINKHLGKKFTNEFVRLFGPEVAEEPLMKLASNMMLLQDPPVHKYTREIAVHAFNKKTIANYAPMIQATVDELVSQVVAKQQFDIVKDFAHPLPLLVICRMLGIEGEDRDDFMENLPLLTTLGRMFDPASLTREDLNNLNDNAVILKEYFSKFYEKYKQKKANDLIMAFANLEENDTITRDVVIANIILLFLAGYETTAKFIGNALLSLYQNPDQLNLLKKNAELFPKAVKELMRYESPMQISGRIVLEDTEIGGKIIPKGETIIPLLGSANRDPEIYHNPDTLNLNRTEIRNMSFGGGIHLCPGEQLSYLETEIALRTLFEKIPRLELLDIDNPSWQVKSALRGLTHLTAICKG